MPHRRAHRLVLGLSASAIALVSACADAGIVAEEPAPDLSTASISMRESYVVARGRFVGGPTVVQSTPDEEELAHSLVLWEFVPDAVYRDVRTADARRGSRRSGAARSSPP